jgi:hypothetical protein
LFGEIGFAAASSSLYAQQRDIVVIPRAQGERCPQFAELGIDRSSRANPAARSGWTLGG